MKYRKVEQCENWMYGGKKHRSGTSRFLKRQSARAMRRAAKRDPENAPKKNRYRGWEF